VSGYSIRRATGADAAGIVAVLSEVVRERVFSAIDEVWAVEQERRYLESLSPREALFVGVDGSAQIIGVQSLDRWRPLLGSMAHVAQLGTFVLPGWRGRGVGGALFRVTQAFARDADFSKIVIQVRGSNESAQAFYRRLGFVQCGRLTRQVRIDGVEDDAVLMELFL
jgi:RimJ/RimL family protein N-acetyltransferase